MVGLAVARQLAAREGTSTLLIERHGSVGFETSSRNSEVSLLRCQILSAMSADLYLHSIPQGHPCRALLRSGFVEDEAMYQG